MRLRNSTQIELHTYSSFNAEFLKGYKGALDAADEAVVFYLPESVKIKKLKEVTPDQISQAFGRKSLQIFTNADAFRDFVFGQNFDNSILLLMSSGNYGGLDLEAVKSLIQT